jgi:DNA-binding transcriptional LysR family regulator
MLNPQWLKTFETLTQLGNFTRTADQLGLTQAAVSQHVRQLESQLGQLLIRRPRQLDLTPAGRSLLAYCAEVGQADQRLKASLSQAHADGGEVSLITPGSIGLYLYPRLLEFQVAHPGFTIRHRFAPDNEVLEAVLQDRYELGLVTLKPDDDRLAATVFTEQELELVAPAGRQLQTWQDLQQLGFIDHPDGRAMASRLLSRVFPGAVRIQDIACHGFINQIGLILEPVARGLGFTVIPRYARQAFARQEEIAVITVGAQVVEQLWLIHRAEWPLSQRAQRVLLHLRRACGGV